MKIISGNVLVLMIALAAAIEGAYGAQPPDVVSSDVVGNTAMGTNALLSLSTGTSNTAAGGNALTSNLAGANNSAGFPSNFLPNLIPGEITPGGYVYAQIRRAHNRILCNSFRHR